MRILTTAGWGEKRVAWPLASKVIGSHLSCLSLAMRVVQPGILQKSTPSSVPFLLLSYSLQHAETKHFDSRQVFPQVRISAVGGHCGAFLQHHVSLWSWLLSNLSLRRPAQGRCASYHWTGQSLCSNLHRYPVPMLPRPPKTAPRRSGLSCGSPERLEISGL